MPEEICTGVPPAKSSPPRMKDHPDEFHVQHAMGSYTMVDQTNTKTITGPSRARSANAPIASMGVMAANISWKTQNAMDGMRVDPTEGFSRTPFSPKYSVVHNQ